MHKLTNFFLPTIHNNYSPVFTKSRSIFVFAIFVFLSNIALGSISTTRGADLIDTDEIIRLHNRERESEGLGELVENTLLSDSAQRKAEAMLDTNCWSHYCPDGKDPWDFFDESGYVYVHAGENLGQGYYSEESVMRAWMNSPTHKENVLKGQFREIGIGVAYGSFQGNADNIVIAVHFGSRNLGSQFLEKVENTTIDPNKPYVNFPEEGEFTNNPKEEISGVANNADEVEIINQDQLLGRVITDGGIFTYRPEVEYPEGKQIIEINSFKDNQYLQTSDRRAFFVDTQKPEVMNSQVNAIGRVNSSNPKVILQFESNEPLKYAKIKSENYAYNFRDVGSNTWQADIPEELILDSDNYNLEIIDLADNTSNENIQTGSIAGLSTEGGNITVQSDNIFTSFTNNLGDQSLKNRLNIALIIFVVAIIVADLVALKKTGMTGMNGKHHHHIGNFMVLLIVILIGGFGGVILNGISI